MRFDKNTGIVRDERGEIIARVSVADEKIGTSDPHNLIIDFARPVTAKQCEEVFGVVTSDKIKA